MKRKTKTKIKNVTLKILASISGANILLFASLLDSDMIYRNLIPWIIVNCISALYLCLLIYANG
jgi:hypothetical protein